MNLDGEGQLNVIRQPALAVDGVIISGGQIVLIRRRNEPYKNKFALPGGFVEYGERVEDACVREVMEETGLRVRIRGLIGVYSDPDRDPRGHVVSVAFLCEPESWEIKAGSDASEVLWVKLRDIIDGKVQLAFDHEKIIRDALERFKIKI